VGEGRVAVSVDVAVDEEHPERRNIHITMGSIFFSIESLSV